MVVVSHPVTCRSPYCDDPPAKGRKFCSYHSEIFDRVRESEEKRCKSVRDQIGRRGKSTCCRPGCHEPRVPPAHFCAQCRDEGWSEEEEE